MQCVPPERDFLYTDYQDVSQRTVYILRALSPEGQRFVRSRLFANTILEITHRPDDTRQQKDARCAWQLRMTPWETCSAVVVCTRSGAMPQPSAQTHASGPSGDAFPPHIQHQVLIR